MFRDVIERFVGRYEIWHEQHRAEGGSRNGNPLTVFALVLAVLVTIDWYRAVTGHEIERRLIVGTVIGVALLVAFVAKSEWAWIIFPILGIIFLHRNALGVSLGDRALPGSRANFIGGYLCRDRLGNNCLRLSSSKTLPSVSRSTEEKRVPPIIQALCRSFCAEESGRAADRSV